MRGFMMKKRTWSVVVVCPICQQKFKSSKVKNHLKKHPGISSEEEQTIRRAAITALHFSKKERLRVSAITEEEMYSATNALMRKKQGIYSAKPMSGGAFGQGKKR